MINFLPKDTINRFSEIFSKVFFMLALGAGILLCCSEKTKSSNILSATEMAEIICETYLIEARVKRLGYLNADSISILLQAYKKFMLEGKGISDTQLKASYAYYLERPEEMEKVMAIAVDTLSLREQKLIMLEEKRDHSDSQLIY